MSNLSTEVSLTTDVSMADHVDGKLSDLLLFTAAQGNVRLHEFGEELRTVIQTIVPNKTPIHLIMDGYSDERVDDSLANYSGFRIGPAPLEVSSGFVFLAGSYDDLTNECNHSPLIERH